MEAHVVETPAGLFILDEKATVLEKVYFSPKPETAAVELKELQEGKPSKEVVEALKRAAKKHSPLVFENEQLARAAAKGEKLKTVVRSLPGC